MYCIEKYCINSSAVKLEDDIMNANCYIDSLEILHLLIDLRGF
jgi:hypothetical protein